MNHHEEASRSRSHAGDRASVFGPIDGAQLPTRGGLQACDADQPGGERLDAPDITFAEEELAKWWREFKTAAPG